MKHLGITVERLDLLISMNNALEHSTRLQWNFILSETGTFLLYVYAVSYYTVYNVSAVHYGDHTTMHPVGLYYIASAHNNHIQYVQYILYALVTS